MSLLKELTAPESTLLWEGEIEGDHFEIHEDLEDGISNVRFVAEASLVNRVTKFAKKKPLTTAIVGMNLAIMAGHQFKKLRRKHTRFFAKTTHEKKLYAQIVKDLMSTGGYKLRRKRFVAGGILWELKKTS